MQNNSLMINLYEDNNEERGKDSEIIGIASV
jgi:hypothetical protein